MQEEDLKAEDFFLSNNNTHLRYIKIDQTSGAVTVESKFLVKGTLDFIRNPLQMSNRSAVLPVDTQKTAKFSQLPVSFFDLNFGSRFDSGFESGSGLFMKN